MSERPQPVEFHVPSEGAGGGEPVMLAGEAAGDGPAIVGLHGLTATRRYVLIGSRALERCGYRTILYDARAHGASEPAPQSDAYGYDELTADLRAVIDGQELERPVLVGGSMGAHTAVAHALERPDSVSALVLITPGYDGRARQDEDELAAWDRLADGLRDGGVDGFLEAWEPPADERWREVAVKATRQRLEQHEHPEAVADAIRVVARAAPFDGLDALERLDVPTLVVGSRDEADPGHPLEVAEAYAERLPDVELAVEEPGHSPLPWQGAQLSRRIADFLDRRL